MSGVCLALLRPVTAVSDKIGFPGLSIALETPRTPRTPRRLARAEATGTVIFIPRIPVRHFEAQTAQVAGSKM